MEQTLFEKPDVPDPLVDLDRVTTIGELEQLAKDHSGVYCDFTKGRGKHHGKTYVHSSVRVVVQKDGRMYRSAKAFTEYIDDSTVIQDWKMGPSTSAQDEFDCYIKYKARVEEHPAESAQTNHALSMVENAAEGSLTWRMRIKLWHLLFEALESATTGTKFSSRLYAYTAEAALDKAFGAKGWLDLPRAVSEKLNKTDDSDDLEPTEDNARHYGEYLALKRQYPDSIVLLLRGLIYETYGDDAQKVSDVLREYPSYTLLVQRTVAKGQRIPVVFVAVSGLDESLSALTLAGYRVALAEQVDKVETNAPGSRMAVERLTAFYDDHPETRPSPASKKQGWAKLTYRVPEGVQCIGCGRISEGEDIGLSDIHWRAYAEAGDTHVNTTWACPACWNMAKLPDPPPPPKPEPIETPKPPTPRLEPGSTKAIERLRAFYKEHQEIHRQIGNSGWHRQYTAHFALHQRCICCGHRIHTDDLGRITEPAFEYFHTADDDSPRSAACWSCWHTAGLPDLSETLYDLANLYRDWLSVTNGDESAYPSTERLLKYQRWAEELVIGGAREREGSDFRRFCRVRMVGKDRGLVDLMTVGKAYHNKVDFPAPKEWACLEESDEHFANRSWESGWKPLSTCVRCGREPAPDDKAEQIGGWLRLCGAPVYLCPDCRAGLNAYRDLQIKEAKHGADKNARAMRKAKSKAKKRKLPDGIPDTIEVDRGRFKGWTTATAEWVKGRWLHYRLPDGQMGKVQILGRDMLWRVPATATS